jgi:hypothetical protein
VLLTFALCRQFTARRLSSDLATLLWCYALIPTGLFTLARTHHFWYIIPTYPAWAILAAAAVVEILEQAERVKLAVPVAAAFAVFVLACQARVVIHNAIHDRMPLSQTFLTSLRTSGVGAGQSVLTTFVPTYSERFLLQVVDGFRLEECSAADLDTIKLAAEAGRSPPRTVLARNGAQSALQGVPDSVGLHTLAQNADYTLIGLSPLHSDLSRDTPLPGMPEARVPESTSRGGRKW